VTAPDIFWPVMVVGSQLVILSQPAFAVSVRVLAVVIILLSLSVAVREWRAA
jgi:hypothetical protein